MNIIYLLIPLALIIAALLIWLFMWAVKSNQFDDLEGPAYKILMDDDKPRPKTDTPEDTQSDASLKAPSPDKKSEDNSG